ncbi:hypothetical protein HK097_007567 [Rhizophlyctis rosea]|uniref:Uncharacterized protein n=1 Tax=Rhizophlyctis rosea TaxID=64517 RepID=A0AAD5SKH7_9FUNG|nr:hypothetical protein HK097_007567 [Rhizophlyctis rosea]
MPAQINRGHFRFHWGNFRLSFPIPNLDRTPTDPDSPPVSFILIPLHKEWSKPPRFFSQWSMALQNHMNREDYYGRLEDINVRVATVFPPGWQLVVPPLFAFSIFMIGVFVPAAVCKNDQMGWCGTFHDNFAGFGVTAFFTFMILAIGTAVYAGHCEKKAVEILNGMFEDWNFDDNLQGLNWLVHYEETVERQYDRDGYARKSIKRQLFIKLEYSANPPTESQQPPVVDPLSRMGVADDGDVPPPAYSEDVAEETPFLGKRLSQ